MLVVFGDKTVFMMQTRPGHPVGNYLDAGASCTDVVDGVITSESGRFVTKGADLIDTSEPDTSPVTFVIEYNCEDKRGNAAPTEERLVIVELLCPGSYVCSDGSCAYVDPEFPTDSVCIGAESVAVQALPVAEFQTKRANINRPTITLLPLNRDCKPAASNGCELTVSTQDGKFIMIQNITQGETYRDAGVLATDVEDGDLTGIVQVDYVDGYVDTSKPTTRPYIISYRVSDLGKPQLAAVEVSRRVHVVNPCAHLAEEEKLCEGSGECSTNGGHCLGIPSIETIPDLIIKPPVVTLRGPAVLTVLQNRGFVKCPVGETVPISAICDRGATANHTLDGDLTGEVLACGKSFADNGVEACRVDTNKLGTYVITFTVADSSGAINDVLVTRTIVVTKACIPPRTLCNDKMSCSDPVTLLCFADTLADYIDIGDEVVDLPPMITLRTHPFLGRFVTVRQYQPYEWCTGEQEPTEKLPCELGVTVVDREEGDLTAHTLICPPLTCLSTGCLLHKKLNPTDGSLNKPLQPYCINTDSAVGTRFEIQFVVFEQQTMPPKHVTVTRTVEIIHGCEVTSFLCPGFPNLDPRECGDIDCDTRSVLSSQVVAADVAPPVLTTSNPAVIMIPYKEASTYKYTLCGNVGDVDCGMSAVDGVDGDVSASLRVVQIKANAADLSCSTAAVTQGQCATGTYVYEYAASDTSGNEVTQRLVVRIVSTGEVIVEFPLGDFPDPGGESKANAVGILYATTGSPQNIVLRKSIADLLSANVQVTALTGAYTEDFIEVIGYSSSRLVNLTMYAALVQVNIKIITGGALAIPAMGSDRRLAQRRRRVLLASSTDDDPDSLLEEQEVGWNAESDLFSAFLGRYHQRALLQTASSSLSALDMYFNAVSGALTGSAEKLTALLTFNAEAAGITVDVSKDPEPPQTKATTPINDIAAVTATALAAELEVMQQRVIQMDIALNAVTNALAQVQGDPTGFKLVLQKAWANSIASGIRGHTDLLKIAAEAVALLDATIKVQAQETEAVLLMQERFLDSRDGLIAQLKVLSQPLAPSQQGHERDQSLTRMCNERDNGRIRLAFNVSRGRDSLKSAASPSPSEGSQPHIPPRRQSPVAQPNANGRKLLNAIEAGGSNVQASEGLTRTFKGYDVPLRTSTQFVEDTGFIPDRMIKGENRVLAGILIYQKRSKVSYECSTRFAHLRVPCRTGESSTEAFGVDPVFKRGAGIFDVHVHDDIGSFYNVSDLRSSVPKGFTQRREDVEKGLHRFPIFFDITSRQSQAYRKMSYLIEGNFIDSATQEIEVNIVSYNPDLRRFTSHKVVFEHTKGGTIESSSHVQVLNMGLYQGTAGVFTFLLESITIVWILYMAFGELRGLIQLRRFLRSSDFEILRALSKHLVRNDAPGSALELVSIMMQIVAVSIWWYYQFRHAFRFSPSKRYEVYYETAQPQGNFFLPAKDRTLNARNLGGVDENNTYTVPRKPYMRWELPEDSTGYDDLTQIVDQVDVMSNWMVVYGFLQGVSLLMLIMRLVKMLKFQPRLAIVANTISGASLDLAHFGIIFITFLMATAVVAHIQYGHNVEGFSTVLESVTLILIIVLGGDSGKDLLQPGVFLQPVEKVSIVIFYTFIPVFFICLLLNFILGILSDAFGNVQEGLREYEGDDIVTDLIKITTYLARRMDPRGSRAWPSHRNLRRMMITAIDTHNNDNFGLLNDNGSDTQEVMDVDDPYASTVDASYPSVESAEESARKVVIIKETRMTRDQLVTSLDRLHTEHVSSVQETGSAATKRRAILGYSLDQLVDQLVAFEYEDDKDENSPETLQPLRDQAAAVRSERVEALRNQMEKYRDSQEEVVAFNVAAMGWMEQADGRLTQLEDHLTLLCEILETQGQEIRGMSKGFGDGGLSGDQRARLLSAVTVAHAKRRKIEEEQSRQMAEMRSRLDPDKAVWSTGDAQPSRWEALRAAVVDEKPEQMITMIDVIQRLKKQGRWGAASSVKLSRLNTHGISDTFRRRHVVRTQLRNRLAAALERAGKYLNL